MPQRSRFRVSRSPQVVTSQRNKVQRIGPSRQRGARSGHGDCHRTILGRHAPRHWIDTEERPIDASPVTKIRGRGSNLLHEIFSGVLTSTRDLIEECIWACLTLCERARRPAFMGAWTGLSVVARRPPVRHLWIEGSPWSSSSRLDRVSVRFPSSSSVIFRRTGQSARVARDRGSRLGRVISDFLGLRAGDRGAPCVGPGGGFAPAC